MHRTILMGSPQENGRCAHLAQEIFDACIEDCPDDGVSIISVGSFAISGCIGCNACKDALGPDDDRYPDIPEKGDPLEQASCVYKSDANAHQCFMQDKMAEFRKHFDAADELIVVSPVYFSSAPSQLKAVLDRLQPYFWSNFLHMSNTRRPFTLHVVGEGGDPYGFDALVSCVRSALSVAGFKIERVLDWTGCIDESGEITQDATEWQIDA